MIDIGMNLRGYGVNIDDNMLVHLALNSLPTDFKQIKSSYVAQKESWSLNELIAICAQEEQNIKKEKSLNHVNLVQDMKPIKKDGYKERNKENNAAGKFKNNDKGSKAIGVTGIKCFFCKKFGHMKKECRRYKRWLEKRQARGVHNQEGANQG
ncbi:hypothetical protein CerSpe_113170 [Prunus speciosa]